jgi:hypothetical protein
LPQKQKAHRRSALAMGFSEIDLLKFSGQQLSRASVGTRTTTATTLAAHLTGKAHFLNH